MAKKPFFQLKTVWMFLLVVALAAVTAWFLRRPKKNDDSVNVPLGVEQAAIVTYSGPPVTVAPYKWGVGVNVRIGKVTETAGARIYDVRYIVNREGTFDLKDYLISENGGPLEGLPSFKFHGDPKLSKHLDARIQETEEITVDVGGHYYEKLAALGAFWIVWLFFLIFYGRAKPPMAAPGPPPEPTLAEMLRHFLTQLESGALDATGKAKMEMLLLRRWREEVGRPDASMSEALAAINRNEKTGQAMRQLQNWLHHPASSVRPEDIKTVITPYTIDKRNAQEVAAR